MNSSVLLGIAIGAAIAFVAVALLLIRRFYRPVESGTALIIRAPGRTTVTFDGALVYPFIHTAEVVDLTTKVIRLSRSGREALLTKDDERADVELVFYLRIQRTIEDVLRAAESIGAAKTRDLAAIDELFRPVLTSKAAEIVRGFSFAELESERTEVEEKLVEVIGHDLNGYFLEQVALERCARTPPETTGPFR